MIVPSKMETNSKLKETLKRNKYQKIPRINKEGKEVHKRR